MHINYINYYYINIINNYSNFDYSNFNFDIILKAAHLKSLLISHGNNKINRFCQQTTYQSRYRKQFHITYSTTRRSIAKTRN